MMQADTSVLVVVWHGGQRLPGTTTKGELLSRRVSGPCPWIDAMVRFSLGELRCSAAYERKQVQEARRRAADAAHPVQYCGCGCGTAIPVGSLVGRRPALFVKGHSRMGAFVRSAREALAARTAGQAVSE